MGALMSRLSSQTPVLAIGASLLVLGVALLGLLSTSARVESAHKARFQSALLADELRQSSDDLTRLARTYVATGDAKWETQYFEVLDIRNGKKPRPLNYQRIYWDFRAADQSPPISSTSVPLQELMKSAGFTEQEFAQLKQAQANSDGLVTTETIAMNLIKGRCKDDSGGYTKACDPDPAKALAMMHDAAYHVEKAKTMAPVAEFQRLLDERTQAAVDSTSGAERSWLMLLVAALVAAVASIVWSMLRAQATLQRLGASPQHVLERVQDIADGNLRRQGDEAPHVMGQLEAMTRALRERVIQVRAAIDSMAGATQAIADGNLNLSQRTEQQSNALQSTAATMEELGTTVRHNADNASQANQLASGASQVAVRGGQVVGQVVETMRGINDSSRKIADITSVIDGIAFQTNILALNAAVEAARAGESGRGFAVVASEVRSLAQRSAEAAREIKSLIGANVERVEQGTDLADRAGQTMQEIVGAIQRVSDIVGEISSASSEQSSGVGQVGQTIVEMDRGTQKDAALVQQSVVAAASLRAQAQQLQQAMEIFKT
jgi:methyl-accepting chemotaxis protein